ncbi:MAG: tyrosine-type recombinase/integrase [Bacteroidales bacterium]|nr:tyrosine-type recombinase/integrase [Bacteroidales bacterium]
MNQTDTDYDLRRVIVMYEEYDNVSALMEKVLKGKGKGAPCISTFRRSVRECKAYMERQEKPYSAEMAAEWLLSIKAQLSQEGYNQLRYTQYRIAKIIVGDEVPKELFYITIQTDFDRIPLWAKNSVMSFLEHSVVGYHFKVGASTFLYRQIQNGLTSLSHITCRMVADYYLEYDSIAGVAPYLLFLALEGEVGPYVPEAYQKIFSSRIYDLKETYVHLAMTDEPKYDIKDYHRAHCTMLQELKTIGYSKTIIKTFNATAKEFGIFLEHNHLPYSSGLVSIYIDVYKNRISENVYPVRRGLLMIEDTLKGKEYCDIPRAYQSKPQRDYPRWVTGYVESYLAERKRNHIGMSALDTDRHSIWRFVQFLDGYGCTTASDINAAMIKAFHLDDEHKTAEGKNAYNVRIRGFLRFLANQNLIATNLVDALPTVNGTKVRPVIILSDEQSETLTQYCTEAENNGLILEAAVLRIATQTGFRAIDISMLKYDNIDWAKMEFSLIQKKTRKHIRVPFSTAVGNAIWRYVLEERPSVKSEYIFISRFAPFDRYTTSQIRNLLGKALGNGEGNVHILRRTFASKLLVSGSTTSLITDALGHITEGTIDPYLSTNGAMMRMCALPLSDRFSYTGGLL